MDGSAACGPNMGLYGLEKDGGPNKIDGLLGRKLKNKAKVTGDSEAGPSWAAEMACHQLNEEGGPEREGPTAPLEKAGLLGCFSPRKGTFSEDPLMSLVLEESRREQRDVGLSMTDRVLEEEAKRYASFSHPKGKRAVGTPLLLFSNSDRALEGESFDRPGGIEEEPRGDMSTWLTVYEGNVENVDGSWKLGEVNKNSDVARGKEGNNGGFGSHHTENEKEDLWEEGSLAKFSQFLGFSTEGLEKEILSFLIKIRKRREKIHSKELLEKTKFERELKRLECSVNYEGGTKQKVPSQANDSSKRKIIKNYIRNQRVDLMCIQETKIQEMSEGIVRSLGSGRFLDWRALNAEGAAGGILICWDKRVLEILDWEEGQFSLSCRFKTIENGATWAFTGVYGPFTKVEREGMWEELGAIRGLWDDPWCLGGDFNITLFQHERSSQRRISSAMRRFAEFVDDLELVDLPLQGGEFTWSGGLNNQAWARLDRFLVSPSWLDQFSGITQGRLSRPTSDHFPIVLEGGGIRRGLTPFRFENMWLKVEGFNDIVKTWWQGIEVRGSASYRLAVKMKEIKKKLKVWNKEVFGRLETNKASALYQVDFWDRVESERVLSMEEAELKKEAKDSFKKWVLLEEAHWRQHSREIWLKDGDKNTGFFHRMASAHRRHNAMDRIKINGEWLVEEQEVREGVVNSFQQLLTEDMGWQADIGSIPVGCISQQDAESLETPFAENEIHSALMEMNGDKAPGPDGFTVAFWQDAWDFVKEEIMEMFREFHEHSSFVKSLNNTFLVLIPKKSGAENLGDFRPISLVGGLYKLLAKVLANRLKKVIGKVVSIAQNAFVKGRQILDASLIANEVIDSWQKRKEKGLICKLDIEKAYDSINWKFLMKVLQKMGFGPKWMGWMWSCVSSAKFSILVNGVPAGFSLALECFVKGTPFPLISLLWEWSKEQVSHLSWILFWFEAASGLRINLAKSEIIPVGDVEDILELAAEATSMWDGVEERIRRRLALWKRQYISKGGRITLIKSTLASLPIYQLSIFRMPKSVAKRVEKTQRDFLWGGGNLEGKVHLVKWDAVCTEKHKGGLGLRRIATLNRALLGKWIWRFACEKNNFWNQVITTKYGQEDYGWRPKKVRGAAGVGVWKEIMKESDWCWENLAFIVGKGSKIKFWKDRWCTDIPLSQSFNQLFVLAVHRDATIEEMWDQDSGQGDWKLVFVRDFNDWEMDMVGELLHTLRGYRPSLEDDSVVWRQGRNGIFKIKEAYRQLDKPNVTVFPARRIWVDRVPTKVCFFAWEATWGKVLTLDRLQLRGVHLPNCCFLCGCEEENVGEHFNWRYAFWGEAILMLPFAVLGFVMKPLQLKGFAPAESKNATVGPETEGTT
ncbi:Transposon TX1 uncharacterized 149 kDa protein [Vitis vinifera]|uniref:Transposon TX1 uncharacterized 149 kDa protein n=1 Tax=Vitis vinifera TaxID=29760 RepID=A0A438KR21_VITVI|nr:Transposon TX1 uncharacterized 149 kDa protein [Vitis vinifera]